MKTITVLEGPGSINSEGAGFGRPLENILRKINVNVKKICLEKEIQMLEKIQNNLIEKNIPIIISGSFYDLKSDVEWYRIFTKILSNLILNKVPMLGICFGSQVIFECMYPGCLVYGGVSEKGIVSFSFEENEHYIFSGLENEQFFTLHSDGIIYSHLHAELITPIALSVVSGKKIYQAYKVNNSQIYGIQFHPEFDSLLYYEMIKLYENNMGISTKWDYLLEKEKYIDVKMEIFKRFVECANG